MHCEAGQSVVHGGAFVGRRRLVVALGGILRGSAPNSTTLLWIHHPPSPPSLSCIRRLTAKFSEPKCNAGCCSPPHCSHGAQLAGTPFGCQALPVSPLPAQAAAPADQTDCRRKSSGCEGLARCRYMGRLFVGLVTCCTSYRLAQSLPPHLVSTM